MIQHGGAWQVTEAAAASWPSPGFVSSRKLLGLQGSQRLWGGLAAGLDVGGGLGSPGVVFAAFGSPCAPSEGNLCAESREKKLESVCR